MGAWSSPAWRAEAVAWLDEQLAAVGRTRTGDVEQPRIRPWATVLRAPTDGGVVWMKATAPATSFEVGLYGVLSRVVPDRVLTPLAADVARGWLVLPDGGATLGDHRTAEQEADGLAAALAEYGQLQRAVVPHVDELLAAGVPDMRPAVMPGRFAEALDVAAASITTDDDRAAHRQVAALTGTVEQWCHQLARSALPASLDHNDLHPKNVLVGGLGPRRFYDWGDSVVAHPFAVTLVTLSVLRQLLDVDGDDPRIVAARDAYLAGFAARAPGEDLVATLRLAGRVATIARALTWARALGSTREQDEPVDPEWATAPLRTLEALLDEPPGGG
ncbi:MAG: phosphotransferase [Ilumatobacteraceae bacterium]